MVGSIFFNSTTRTFQANLGITASPSWNNFTVSDPVVVSGNALGYYKATHLLRRTCYKVTKSMILQYTNKTPQQALDDLFV